LFIEVSPFRLAPRAARQAVVETILGCSMRRVPVPEQPFELTFIKDCKILFLKTLSWRICARQGCLLALTRRVIYPSPDSVPRDSISRAMTLSAVPF
jgi:hypothetical protein